MINSKDEQFQDRSFRILLFQLLDLNT